MKFAIVAILLVAIAYNCQGSSVPESNDQDGGMSNNQGLVPNLLDSLSDILDGVLKSGSTNKDKTSAISSEDMKQYVNQVIKEYQEKNQENTVNVEVPINNVEQSE